MSLCYLNDEQIIEFVGNKAKGRILKRVFQENKTRKIFRKMNISYPLIRTRTSYHDNSYSKVKKNYLKTLLIIQKQQQ